jgi:hypothetical protein
MTSAATASPEEWLRQVAHEWGHYALPMMGRFSEPEPDAAGALGEALFLQLLAAGGGARGRMTRGRQRARSAAINGLWGHGDVSAGGAAERRCASGLLDLWLKRGAELATGGGARRGRVQLPRWRDDAVGGGGARARDAERSTLLKAPGETPADYYYGYRQADPGGGRAGRDHDPRGRAGP